MKNLSPYLLQLLEHRPTAVPEPKVAAYFDLIFFVEIEDRYTLLGRLLQGLN